MQKPRKRSPDSLRLNLIFVFLNGPSAPVNGGLDFLSTVSVKQDFQSDAPLLAVLGSVIPGSRHQLAARNADVL
jgi:hypothetical protein